MKEKFKITGMSCAACSVHIEKAVSVLDGVKKADVNLLSEYMMVEYDEKVLTQGKIIETVISAGYGAALFENKDISLKESRAETDLKSTKQGLITSFVFLALLMYISMGHMLGLPLPAFFHGEKNALVFAFTQFLLTLPITYINRKYFIKGYKSLFKRTPNMDSLIAIGSSAAIFYGIYAIYRISFALGLSDFEAVNQFMMNLYFESAGTILTLISLGKYLELLAKRKTTSAINKLLDLRPKTVIIETDDGEKEIIAEELQKDDIFIIKAGDYIPADGVIVFGNGSFDQSAVTGESLAVERNTDDSLISASICKSGYVKVKAQKVGSDTVLSQIIRLVDEAANSKAPIAKLADKVSRIFVPIVIVIAIITFAIWLILDGDLEFALSNAISVLVISCPCALGLATPVAIMVGTGKGAENGILIKNAESLELVHKAKTIVFDKTGTITVGKPSVINIISDDLSDKEMLKKVAYSLEKSSEHPLAEAIIEYSLDNNIIYEECHDYTAHTGRGISGIINNERYYAGNNLFLTEITGISDGECINKAKAYAEKGETPLFIFSRNKILGIITIADKITKNAETTILVLKGNGIKPIMLTGDNKLTANAISARIGIGEVISDVFPAEKAEKIAEIKKKGLVIMVGDGVNDAPSLALADVGVAIGKGTDIAIDAADIVLLNSDISDIPKMIKLSKKVIRNIKQNLFWAFFYNCIGIPIAAGALYKAFGIGLNPMLAAAAMSMSSLFVVGNALRLRGVKLKDIRNGGENMIRLEIEGMSCGHCVKRIEDKLNSLEGVTAAVSLEEKSAEIHSLGLYTADELAKIVTELGYNSKPRV